MASKLLIVDDEVPFAESLAAHLRRCGYDVVVAFEGSRAIQVITDEQPGLAFVDLKLPGLNGEALIREARRLSPSTKIVVLTAYHDEGLKEAALRHVGVVGYLYKPLTSLVDLERYIQELVGAPPRAQG